MRILHLVTPRGDENAALELVAALAALGVGGEIVAARDRPILEDSARLGVESHAVEFAGLFDLVTRRMVEAAIGGFRPHIILCHDAAACSYLPQGGSAPCLLLESDSVVKNTVGVMRVSMPDAGSPEDVARALLRDFAKKLGGVG